MGRTQTIKRRGLLSHLTTQLFVAIVASLAVAAVAAAQPTSNPKLRTHAGGIPNRWLVQLAPRTGADIGRSVSDIAEDLRLQFGGSVTHVFKFGNGFSVQLPANVAVALSRSPRVAWVEQDQPAIPASIESAPSWGLDRIDQSSSTLDSQYHYFVRGSGVHVYVIDSGIRTTHEDFGGRADVVADETGGDGQDCFGHGTHVAGIIGGTTYGVAKAVSLHALRVFDCSGNGTTADVAAALDDAVSDKNSNHPSSPAVINMSLVISGYDSTVASEIGTALFYDIAVVAAAGNSDANGSGFPASLSSSSAVISVAASTSSDQKASYSNYGSDVTLFAPGDSILSDYSGSDTDVEYDSGTSMAAPHVTGVVALYFENSGWTDPGTLRSTLSAHATANVLGSVPSGTPNKLLRVEPNWDYVGSDYLYAGQELTQNQALTSENGEYALVLQTDGNLVLYGQDVTAYWSSDTDGEGGTYALMQTDGNFVVYDAYYDPLFWTNTDGNSGAFLRVQDDSNVVVYSSGWVALWAWFGL